MLPPEQQLASTPETAPAPQAPPNPFPRERYDALIADSPIKSMEARRGLAEAACTLMQQMAAIRRHVETGTATGEEHRALSGIASNLRRVIESLGLTSSRPDEDL